MNIDGKYLSHKPTNQLNQSIPIKILFYNKIGILLVNLDLRKYTIDTSKEKSTTIN